jgi:hypothetical protein
MSILELYVERATQCRQEAEATPLANVRERCLRSASAWESMADKLRVTETYRANDAIRKAEQAAPAHVLEPLLVIPTGNVG